MDLKNTSVILKKINRLYELISEIGEASATENDLLKAYVLDLYEAVTMSDIEATSDHDEEEMQKIIKKQKKLEKKIKKQLNKNAASISSTDEEDLEENEQPEEVAAEIPAESVEKEEEKTAVSIDPELLSLFEIEGGSDLSDKLSLSPVSDLTKAMGINEKIFTINELFGGQQEEFDNMMTALNGLNSFDEAKSVLINSVAPKYDWQNPKNHKKAKHFIRLVQRRFN